MMLLVGTVKGGFILDGDSSRRNWKLRGPYFDGYETYDMVADTSGGKPTLYAGVNTWTWGPVIYKSVNRGATWKRAKSSPRFAPKKGGLAVKRVWNLQPDGDGKLYAGVEPAALFVSEDDSASWQGFDGLNYHETREKWQPGNGGLCLHTIVIHPRNRKKIRVGISSVGVVGSDDDGATWRFMNRKIRAGFLPYKYPTYGQCVHKIDYNPSKPDTLYLQNHGGVYRSEDFGERWTEADKGLPSDFGFPIAVHRTKQDMVYVFPLEGMGRFPPKGKFQVWITRNGGKDWTASDKGLPERAYFGVLREAVALDGEEPGGVYCGTSTGQVYYSRNEGDSWEEMVRNLPRITSVSLLDA
jgi:phage pi2 protein 07